MARIRTLKPEMWSSESVGRLSRDARLLLVALITNVDDDGRIRASSRGLASLLYPFDADAAGKIDGWLMELQGEGMFVRYLADGSTYGYLPKFKSHQKIDHPSASKLPAFTDILANPREASRILAPDQDQGSRIRDQYHGGERGAAAADVAEATKKKKTDSPELACAKRHTFRLKGSVADKKNALNDLIKLIGIAEVDIQLANLSGVWASDLHGHIVPLAPPRASEADDFGPPPQMIDMSGSTAK